jgi:NADH-quinone oxidoreductase subunit J
MLTQVIFFLLAILAIVAAFGLIFSRNPVSSALWLVLNLFSIAGLYLTLNAEFIGIIQILVYAGAIMVLFLFVIMLLNLGSLPSLARLDWRIVAGFLVGAAVLAQLVYVIAASLDVLPTMVIAEDAALTGSASAIGLELFTRYALPLQIIGILLLAATIGAVMIAKRRFA